MVDLGPCLEHDLFQGHRGLDQSQVTGVRRSNLLGVLEVTHKSDGRAAMNKQNKNGRQPHFISFNCFLPPPF